jgi:hypothetical protein
MTDAAIDTTKPRKPRADKGQPRAPKAAAAKTAAPKADGAVSTPFKSPADIKLGMKVRDPASGLIGIAGHRTELISGTVQFAIQPEGDGKSVPNSYYVDDFLLEYVDDGISAKCPTPAPADYPLGVELKDTITGFTGIAVERCTYLNGCIHYTLQPEETKKSAIAGLLGETARATHFDYKRLKPTKAGQKAIDKLKPEEKTFKRSPTGGPTRMAASSMAASSMVAR